MLYPSRTACRQCCVHHMAKLERWFTRSTTITWPPLYLIFLKLLMSLLIWCAAFQALDTISTLVELHFLAFSVKKVLWGLTLCTAPMREIFGRLAGGWNICPSSILTTALTACVVGGRRRGYTRVRYHLKVFVCLAYSATCKLSMSSWKLRQSS